MGDNAAQIADWDGPVGEVWANLQKELDEVTRRYGDPALMAANVRPGERVIDVGCGCGDSSLTLAREVGPSGSVLGVDVSEPMLAVAGQRAEGIANLAFQRLDASQAKLSGDHDLIFSRFGVMFFDDPTAAFTNMHAWLRPGGRLTFVCWRHPRENPWAIVPVVAAREALKLEAPPADLNAPGPFAFHDLARLESILRDAGFSGFEARPLDAPMPMGANVVEAADRMTSYGPGFRVVREAGMEKRPIAAAAIAKALEPYAAADGSVSLNGAVWIVTARA